MSSFVPTQFSSFTENFDFDKLKTDTSSTFHSRLRSLKRPSDFFDFSRYSKPTGLIDAQQRITFNLNYFGSNYLLVVGLFFLYCIFTNITFFLFLGIEGAIVYGAQRAFGNGDEINLKLFVLHKNVFYTVLLALNLPILLFWSPLGSLFWLSVMSGSLVMVHAAIIDKPVEAAYSDAV